MSWISLNESKLWITCPYKFLLWDQENLIKYSLINLNQFFNLWHYTPHSFCKSSVKKCQEWADRTPVDLKKKKKKNLQNFDDRYLIFFKSLYKLVDIDFIVDNYLHFNLCKSI